MTMTDEDWEPEIAAPAWDFEKAWRNQTVWDAVGKLGPKDSKIIKLRYREGRSVQAISKRLRMSQRAVAKRLQRALADLRQYLGRRLYV